MKPANKLTSAPVNRIAQEHSGAFGAGVNFVRSMIAPAGSGPR